MKNMSLRNRMGLYVVTCITLILSAFTYFNYQSTKSQRGAQILESTQRVNERLVLSLPGPLWNYEKTFVNAAIRSELHDPNISAIFVDKGTRFIAGQVRDSKGTIVAATEAPADTADSLRTDIYFDDGSTKHAVGTLHIQYNDRALQDELDASLLRAIVQTVMLDLAIILILMFLLYSNVLRPLRLMHAALADLSEGEGDLSRRLAIRRMDEVGGLADSTNRFVEKLQNIIKDIGALSEKVLGSSNVCQAQAIHNANSINIQQMELDQAATAITEMTSAVEEVAQNANLTSVATGEANLHVENAVELSDYANQAIAGLVTEVERVANLTESLAQESGAIDQVIEVINAIAEQTNLLALNAAIEAARAGDQGRGFAVVADEVRTLAGRTRHSTEEIRNIIQRLQDSTRDVVEAMALSRTMANEAGRKSDAVRESVLQFYETMQKISEMNTYIAQAAEEQHSVAEGVSQSLTRISVLNTENAQSIDLSKTASSSMQALANSLDNLIHKFRV